MSTEQRLLDVGCGDGSTAREHGWADAYDYVGVDIDGECVDQARQRGLAVERADVMDGLDYSDGEFDRVIAKAVLEHVEDPLFVARECARVCKAGGEVYVVVPSDRSYDLWGDYTHRRGFRRDALRDLLSDAGFVSITIRRRTDWRPLGAGLKNLYRALAPWTPYGLPRAWEAYAWPGRAI